jgi:hypothetical protein
MQDLMEALDSRGISQSVININDRKILLSETFLDIQEDCAFQSFARGLLNHLRIESDQSLLLETMHLTSIAA